jgi:hypothetical protein
MGARKGGVKVSRYREVLGAAGTGLGDPSRRILDDRMDELGGMGILTIGGGKWKDPKIRVTTSTLIRQWVK